MTNAPNITFSYPVIKVVTEISITAVAQKECFDDVCNYLQQSAFNTAVQEFQILECFGRHVLVNKNQWYSYNLL